MTSSTLPPNAQVSLEPPRSFKASLQQLVAGSGTPVVGRDVFESDDCGVSWRQLLFGLCLFHAAANGRKVYGTRGWNIPHSFTHTDLQVFGWTGILRYEVGKSLRVNVDGTYPT